ncbi:MAG: RHS repeat-associated core domain-containing protein [Myxococcaceae bacterium]
MPSKVVHADGSETRYTRDVDGRVREEAFYENSATLHSRTVITRNVQGQPTRTQRLSRMGVDLGSVWQDWDEEGRLLFECAEASPGGCAVGGYGSVPADGASRTLWYSKDGRLSSEMDSEGAYTRYTRDARGWVTQIRRQAAGEADRVTAMTWSDNGDLLTRVEGGGAATRREARTWDGFGRLSTVSVGPAGTPYLATTIRHSRRDLVSSVETVGTGSTGAPTSWATHSIRDDFGRVLEQWTNGQRTLKVWRKPGGRVWKSQALGSAPRFMAHDEFGRVVFEQFGQVKTARVAPADLRFEGVARIRNERGLKTNNVERSLSALGGVLSETELGFDGTSSPPSRVASYVLDDNDFVRFATDALGATSDTTRDLLGRPLTVRVPVSSGVIKTTEYRYNRRGQLTRITEPRGSSFGYTTQTYTGFGEPKTRTVPGGTTATPNDVVQTWTYDVLGRMVSEDVGPARLRYSYANDRVWRINNQTEQVLREFAYDGLGRLTEATHYNRGLTGLVADAERPVVSTFSYDTLGRRVSETSQVGTRTVRSTASNWLVTGGGWRRNTTRADGASQVELFDTMGRLSSMSRPWTGRQSEWKYEGELEAMELHDTATTQFQRTLEYDGLNQLMANAYNTGSTVYATTLLRDRAGRVMSANRVFSQPGQAESKAWRGYKYQEGGALETVMELDDTIQMSGLNPTDTTWSQVQAAGQAKGAAQYDYTRDVEGSVLSVNRVDIAGQAPRFEAPARQRGYQMEWYKLDGSGNGMTHDGAGRVTAEFGRTYTYDDFHSLVRAGAASGNNAQGFQYDAVGRLIAVRRGTAGWPVEEELAYDGTQMVAAWNGAGVATWSAVWGQGVDNLISVKPGVDGAEVMALKDGRGSVVGYYQAEATPQGLLATADYTPEGRVTSKDWVTGTTCTETGSTQCPRLGGLPFGFHGAYKSPAHGLLYFRNRWYSAEAGQWLTQDPLGEVDSVNLYAFNRFDSVNFIDPFGLSGEGAAEVASPEEGGAQSPSVKGEKCGAGSQGCEMPADLTPLPPKPEFNWTFTALEYAADVQADLAFKSKEGLEKAYEGWKAYGSYLSEVHPSFWVFPNIYAVANANRQVESQLIQQAMRAGLTRTDIESIGLLAATFDAIPEATYALAGLEARATQETQRGIESVALSPLIGSARADRELAAAAESITPKAGRTDVVVHANKNGFFVRTKDGAEEWAKISPARVAQIMRDRGYTGGPVRLIAWEAGKCENGPAQQLANELQSPVYAATDKVHVYLDTGRITTGPKAGQKAGEWKWFQPK